MASPGSQSPSGEAGLLPEIAELRKAAQALWPERRLSGFQVNRDGWDNLVLETREQLFFRFPRTLEVARRLGFEVRLLEYLSERLATPIPEPLRLGTLRIRGGWPFLSYRKLPGVPLATARCLGRAERTRLGVFLARLLDELATLPVRPLRRLGCESGTPTYWRRRYVDLLARYDRLGTRFLPPEVDRRLREGFRTFFEGLSRSRYAPVLCHLDLGPSNILWDPRSRSPKGVVDWEDARIGDPAFDLTGLRFLGERLLDPLLRKRKAHGDDRFADRLPFYRRVVGVHELLHGAERGLRSLVREGARELRCAFPAEATAYRTSVSSPHTALDGRS